MDRIDTMKFVLEHYGNDGKELDVDAVDSEGRTAIHVAAREGHVKVINLEKNYTFGMSDTGRQTVDDGAAREVARGRNLEAVREAVIKREQEDDGHQKIDDDAAAREVVRGRNLEATAAIKAMSLRVVTKRETF
ncbi:hypothetical protein JHK87_010424 [Glycine soja]|nr:hypothetical protein JHK87_010424 [Glycine soja]